MPSNKDNLLPLTNVAYQRPSSKSKARLFARKFKAVGLILYKETNAVLPSFLRCSYSTFQTILISIIVCGKIFFMLMLFAFFMPKTQPSAMTQHGTPVKSENTKFAAKVMRAKIWSKLKQLQEPADCEQTEYLTCDISSSYSFSGYVVKALQCLAHAHREEKTMVFADDKAGFDGHAWNEFLLPISKCQAHYNEHKDSIDSFNSTTRFVNEKDQWKRHTEWVPNYTKSFLNTNNMKHPPGWFVGIMNGYLFRRFQPTLETFIAEKRKQLFPNLKEYEIRFDVAVHIEQADKVPMNNAKPFSVREYVNEIDHLIALKRNDKYYHRSYNKKYGIDVYVATNTPSVFQELTKDFSQYNWFYNQKKVEHGARDKAAIMNEIFDVIMMSKSDYFVGTMSSDVGRMVFQLMANEYVNPAQYVYSLDEMYSVAV